MTVTVVSTSPGKRREALENPGADSFMVSDDAEQIRADGHHGRRRHRDAVGMAPDRAAAGAAQTDGGRSWCWARRPGRWSCRWPPSCPAGRVSLGAWSADVADCQAMLDLAGWHAPSALRWMEVIKMD
ncbi:hypothetical protein EJB05_28344, partial [Eragrostis curvula]